MSSNDEVRVEINKGRWIGVIVSILLTVVIIYFLFRLVDVDEIIQLIKDARRETLLLAFFLYLLVYVFRILRLRTFSECQQITPFALARIVTIHYLLNMILPARTGELTFPYMLRRWHKISFGEGTSFLVLTRVYDFLGMAITLLAAVFFYSLTNQNEVILPLMTASGILLIALIVGVFTLKPLLRWAVAVWKRWTGKPSLVEKPLIKRLTASLERAYAVIEKSATPQKALRLLLTSFVIWLLLYGIYYLFLISFGYTAYSFGEVVIGSTGGVLAGVLPINTTGSWGTLEAGWTAGFYLVGMPVEDGVLTGFAQHSMLLIFSLCVLPFAWIGHLLTKKNEPS